MNTATMVHDDAPRALRAGEWMGEAALAISAWLIKTAQSLRPSAVLRAHVLRGHAQELVAIEPLHRPR